MPAKNLYHDAVVNSLKSDGWTITHDPLTLVVGDRNLHIDLGAEQMPIGAEKAGRKIAVEVQSFCSPSPIADLQQALGQYVMYRAFLAREQPDRVLFLAVPVGTYDGILTELVGSVMLTELAVWLLVFDPSSQEVVRWTN